MNNCCTPPEGLSGPLYQVTLPARALIRPLFFQKVFRLSRLRTEGLSGHLRVYQATCDVSLYPRMGLSGHFYRFSGTCIYRALWKETNSIRSLRDIGLTSSYTLKMSLLLKKMLNFFLEDMILNPILN